MDTYSQTTIKGTAKDENNSSLAGVNVILYENSKIIEYTKSDSIGNFQLEKQLLEGIYLVEGRKFGYKKFNQNIVVGTDTKQLISLEIVLNGSEIIELKEVQIVSKPPIIVKKDTIIYNIDKLKDVYDNNLEQVLAKIQGFKIQANGEIEVNGKIIRKVIIDGKEVSDLGSALLTQTLSPNDIKEIEVRFDEKNNKLKESLLDDGKFAVLDIKLKEDLNKSFFGNIQGNFGYQNNEKFGGYSNLFSLNKKVNIQAFGENTNFGNNKISLAQIRNIGEEANAKIMSLPIDYNEVKKRKGLSDELYGFNNFTQNDNSILGISINYVIDEKTDLFIGSFNNYHFMKNQSFTNQFYINDLINNIDLNNT
ncbi:carboxypeptidase-like regulatory domain-containing protein [Flavobacterium sp. PL11]|uniref:carboxypeptidase-like regulatory domain-containing protein n=1 Tax=Flavobacterium sp. PL11 TaxID=3071717 RepID=UPI002E0D9672